jgi:integrase
MTDWEDLAQRQVAEIQRALPEPIRVRAMEVPVFTLDELRVVLDVADPEWKSMILFGLYTGQRLADVATVHWSNVDLVKSEIRLTARKTDKVMILPTAAPLRRFLEGLPSSDDGNTPIHPPLLKSSSGKASQAGYRASLLTCWPRPGSGKSNLTDPEVLGDLPNGKPVHYRSTVCAEQLPPCFMKPAFPRPSCRA